MSIDLEETPKITDAPEVIWLNYGELEKTESHRDVLNNGEVLWCEDQIDSGDVKYIRADTILARLEAAENEREQLNEQLRKMGADWLATAINGMAESLPAARIRSLVEQHGSYRKVGELLGVDHAYLHRIVSGEKDNMSDELLRKIGLRRGTFYAAFDKEAA